MDLRQLSDVELIFLILAAVYCWESACWLRGQAMCLAPRIWRYRPVRAALFLENDHGRLVGTGPLPSALSLVCQPWPVAISPEGIDVEDGAAGSVEPTLAPLSWEEVRSVAPGEHELRINGKVVAVMASAEHARALARALLRIVDAPRGERRKAVERAIRATADVQAAEKRWAEVREATGALRRLGGFFFAYTFILGPFLYYRPGPDPWATLAAYLFGFVVVWLGCVGQYARVRRTLYGESWTKCLSHLSMMLFSPASAIRAADLAARHALAAYHPLTAALVVCPDDVKRDYARRILLDLHYPLSGRVGQPGAAPGVAEWYRQRLLEELEQAVRRAGLDPAEVLGAPLPDPDARSYCPRCRCQFVLAQGQCDPCGGLCLEPFPAKLTAPA